MPASPPAPKPADERLQQVGRLRRFLSGPETGAVAGAIIIFVFFSVVAGDKGFLAQRGIRSWMEVSAQLGIIGLGATLLMIGGQFDLSVGSMIAAAGMLFLLPVVEFGWPIWLALLQVFDLGSADVTRGTLKEFEAIIVAVIGGTLLTGGYGTAVGAVSGALIFGMTSQGIFIARWNTDWFRVFLGALLLVAVIFNNYIRKRATEAS